MTEDPQGPSPLDRSKVRASRWRRLLDWSSLLGALISMVASLLSGLLLDTGIKPIDAPFAVAVTIAAGLATGGYFALAAFKSRQRSREALLGKIAERDSELLAEIEHHVIAVFREEGV